MSRRRPEKLDGIDADNIFTVVNGAGWRLIRERIETALSKKRDELETPLDPIKTAEVRGHIDGLKVALKVPDILMAEAKENRTDES